MNSRDIIDVQLELFFGDRFPHKIQRLVDDELSRGHWVDGYHLAVCQGVVDGDDARKLLQIVLREYPKLQIDRTNLERLVDKHLPQSQFARVSWICGDDGSFAMTDSLRVAKFQINALAWVSPRISYDGIAFDSLKDGMLRGWAWLLGMDDVLNEPFTINFETGELLEGCNVDEE